MTLPEPAYCLASNGRLMKTDGDVDCTGKQLTIYTADQMREYGAAVAAEKDAMIEAQGRTLQTMMKNTIMLGKDLDDQLRLNSMGSEREYVLAGKVAQLERERDTLRNQLHTCGPTCSKAGCVNRRLSEERDALALDAELGRIAMRFVDRAGDYCNIDPAERICDQFYKAMADQVSANRDAAMKGKS